MVPSNNFAAFIASGTVRFVFCDEQQFLNKSWCIALPFNIALENNSQRCVLVVFENKQCIWIFDVLMFVAISSAIIVHALLPSIYVNILIYYNKILTNSLPIQICLYLKNCFNCKKQKNIL